MIIHIFRKENIHRKQKYVCVCVLAFWSNILASVPLLRTAFLSMIKSRRSKRSSSPMSCMIYILLLGIPDHSNVSWLTCANDVRIVGVASTFHLINTCIYNLYACLYNYITCDLKKCILI